MSLPKPDIVRHRLRVSWVTKSVLVVKKGPIERMEPRPYSSIHA